VLTEERNARARTLEDMRASAAAAARERQQRQAYLAQCQLQMTQLDQEKKAAVKSP